MKLKFKLHWSFIVLALGLIYFNKTLTFLCYLLAVILHEIGHAVVASKLGYKLSTITLMPYGASLSGSAQSITKKHEVFIVIAGPCVNLILCISAFLLLKLNINFKLLNLFYIANSSTLLFNLLPVYPLDGGRLLFVFLTKNIGLSRAFKLTKIVGAIVCGLFIILFILSYFYNLNYMLGINALFLLISLLDDNGAFYYNKISDLEECNNKTKCKYYKINQNQTILNTYKLLDKSCYCKIAILDKNNVEQKVISHEDIKDKLFKSEYTKTLKEAFLYN